MHFQSFTKKASKPIAAGDATGELTQLPRPGNRPSPKPHPRSQHFGLPASALGAEATEGPKLLVNQGPSEPCYTTVPPPHHHHHHFIVNKAWQNVARCAHWCNRLAPSAYCGLTVWRRQLCSRCSVRLSSLSLLTPLRRHGVVGLYDFRRPTAYRCCSTPSCSFWLVDIVWEVFVADFLQSKCDFKPKTAVLHFWAPFGAYGQRTMIILGSLESA